jgi:hypothetical protein
MVHKPKHKEIFTIKIPFHNMMAKSRERIAGLSPVHSPRLSIEIPKTTFVMDLVLLFAHFWTFSSEKSGND